MYVNNNELLYTHHNIVYIEKIALFLYIFQSTSKNWKSKWPHFGLHTLAMLRQRSWPSQHQNASLKACLRTRRTRWCATYRVALTGDKERDMWEGRGVGRKGVGGRGWEGGGRRMGGRGLGGDQVSII